MKILIAGVGAIGSNLASLLVPDLRGEHEITILDMDKVEARNVQAGTQFYMPDQIGLSKVEALQYNLYKTFNREVIIQNQELVRGVEPTTLGLGYYHLIIDCFDNYQGRQILQDHYDSHQVLNRAGNPCRLLHVGFSDQFTYAIEWGDNYKVPSDIMSGMDICEMEGAASFVKMVSALASLVVQDFVQRGEMKEYVGNRLTIRQMA